MNEEKVIRKEAQDFYNLRLEYSDGYEIIDDFHKIGSRLNDFYSPESKAIFLDEIQHIYNTKLIEHRNQKHNGEASESCQFEIDIEKLLFYIKQELNTLPVVAHQRFQQKNEKLRTKVFISYSHFDKDYLKDIQRHFKPFLNQIDFWDDSKILPGKKWKDEIRQAILETKVAILLVSTDFLGSEFIATNELPPLLEAAEKEGAVILTVILKPCLFEEFVELNKFQALNPPSRPVSKMDSNEKEELFVNVVRQTKRILNE